MLQLYLKVPVSDVRLPLGEKKLHATSNVSELEDL